MPERRDHVRAHVIGDEDEDVGRPGRCLGVKPGGTGEQGTNTKGGQE
jgi:hypothetical protein